MYACVDYSMDPWILHSTEDFDLLSLFNLIFFSLKFKNFILFFMISLPFLFSGFSMDKYTTVDLWAFLKQDMSKEV